MKELNQNESKEIAGGVGLLVIQDPWKPTPTFPGDIVVPLPSVIDPICPAEPYYVSRD